MVPTVTEEGETVRPEATILTAACADFDVSATLVAATVTLEGDGTTAGAEYSPAVEIVPTVELPPVTPLTLQITALFEDPVTVAANC
jgi:hypothetical protein